MSTPNLNRVLVPRDSAGHIQPMVFSGGVDGAGQPVHYPSLPPRPDGKIDPMVFDCDFCPGGRFYGRVEYFPGFYQGSLGVVAGGTMFPLLPGNVVFCDPMYNLPALSRSIFANGIPPEWMSAATQLSDTLAQRGVFPSSTGSGVELDSDTMFLRNQKGVSVPICNCHIMVQRLVKTVKLTGELFEIELLLTAEGIREQVRIPEKDLDKIASFLGARFPWFHLSSERNAAILLNAYIRDRLKAAPCHTIFKSCGWTALNGKHIYAHDGCHATVDFSFDCGRAILTDHGLTASQAFCSARGILDIGVLPVTLPLFLTALLGVLAALFEAAGYPPQFCTFLHGLSGSLKTATAEVFANFYGVRDHSSFRDTPAAIDVAVGEHRDRVLLVDDFQPATTAAEGQNMKKVLEHLLRLFGDTIGKKRSNSHATAAKGTRPRSSCIITGESTSGSYSSLLRCLMVPISRGDIDGSRLRTYQENPTLFTSIYSHLLPWVTENWDDLVSMIRTSFPSERASFGEVTPEPRLADTGAVLKLTGMIYLEYGLICGGIDQTEYHQRLAEWEGVIRGLLTVSTEASQELNLVALTREAISSALLSGSLDIAPNPESYRAGMGGFYTSDRLWLRQEALSKLIQNFCYETQVTCVPMKEILPELYARGMIIRDEESKKNSFLKRTPILPSLDRQRPRMLCFVLAELRLDD